MITFVYVGFFVVPVFTQYFWAEPAIVGVFDLVGHRPQDIVAGQLAALVGLICMVAGFHLPVGRAISRRLPKLEPEWSHGTVLMVALVMIPVGWMVFLAGQSGLIPARAGSGFIGLIAKSVYFVIGFLALAFIRYRSKPALILLLLVIPPTMAYSFFTGTKRLFLLPLFMVAMAYILVERRIRISFVVGGVLMLIVLYPVSNFYREVVQRGLTIGAVEVLRNPGRAISQISRFVSSLEASEYLTSGAEAAGQRLNALGTTTVIVRDTPSRVPYQGGWSIGYIFISYIPRVLWAGKPETTIGQWVTDTYGSGPRIRSNTGASWIGELYFNFSYPGVIFGMLLLGIWFRLLQEHFFGLDATIPALVLAIVIIEETAQTIGGFLIAPINGTVWTIALIVFVHLVVRLMSPPPRRPIAVDT
jgi:hypothetical protein